MAKLVRTQLVDGFLDRWYLEDGVYYRVREEAARELVLQTNRELQKNPDALKESDWGRWSLSIPLDDYAVLTQRYPELASTDRMVKHRAYQKFMKSSESIPYRVVPMRRGMTA